MTEWLIDTDRRLLALSTSSFTPTTVTVCSVFQLLVVNVNATDAVAAPADPPGPNTFAAEDEPDVTVTSTLFNGCDTSRTV